MIASALRVCAVLAVCAALVAGRLHARPDEAPPTGDASAGAARRRPAARHLELRSAGPAGAGHPGGSRGQRRRSRAASTTTARSSSPVATQTLDRQAAWLKQYPDVIVTVEGHADERGTREYNLALGDRRANAVKNYLVALAGRAPIAS